MGKVALVFPGQGSQYVGMGKELYESNTTYKRIVDEACEALEFDISEIMFNNSEELAKTENTQPAILLHSIALLECIKENIDLEFDSCLGLSLGEYSALVASGSIKYLDAIKLVKKRGKIMQDSVPIGEGSMAAVLGMEKEKLNKIVNTFNTGVLEVANYNCPGQIVISGTTDNIEKAMITLKENGAKRVAKLNVSGPFHSSMLEDASAKLKYELDKIQIKKPIINVISNVNADYYQDDIKELLVRQVKSSVLWEDSIVKLLNEGYDTFIEVGCGKTLKGFIKKISAKEGIDCSIKNVDDKESLENFLKEYKKGSVIC